MITSLLTDKEKSILALVSFQHLEIVVRTLYCSPKMSEKEAISLANPRVSYFFLVSFPFLIHPFFSIVHSPNPTPRPLGIPLHPTASPRPTHQPDQTSPPRLDSSTPTSQSGRSFPFPPPHPTSRLRSKRRSWRYLHGFSVPNSSLSTHHPRQRHRVSRQ